MEKLPAPKILIPAAAGIIIIILVVIFVLPSGTPETVETVEPPKTKETAPKQETAKPPQLSPEEQQQRDILYTRKFKLAQRDFNAGKYDKAQEHLTAAEKGKTTKESEALKQKIQVKLAEKEDNKTFKQAAAANTAAAYGEYLNKYASGRHAEEARKKIAAFKEEERKREAQRKKWAASRVTLRAVPTTL
ncbi:MAG: hypothetical protein GY950_35725, partial [bacterium]|nr:hypothetical protein [bacterium]